MKKTVLCYGDSNTHGYCSETGGRFSEEERWTCLLQKALGEDYRIIEEGLSGRTTVYDDPLFESLNGLSTLFSNMMSHEPLDLLIIMLGTNDTKARFASGARNIAKGLERLTAKAISVREAWRSTPNILLIAPAPIEDGYAATDAGDEMGPGCAEKSRRLAPAYREVAQRQGCHFLDAGTLGLTMYPADCMHLDRIAHARLAGALAQLIPGLCKDR